MSRIALKPISVPSGVTVKMEGRTVRVKGPKGELVQTLGRNVKLDVKDAVQVSIANTKDRQQRINWGTAASLIRSMIKGVSEGFERQLDINGVGYRAELKGKAINFTLGHSHPILFPLPEGVTAKVPQPTQVILSSANKQVLGQAAATIRSLRPVEPYKGKGVMYAGQHVRRKEGKKAGK